MQPTNTLLVSSFERFPILSVREMIVDNGCIHHRIFRILSGMEMLQSHRVDKLWIHVYFQLVDQCRRRIAVAIAAANECIH